MYISRRFFSFLILFAVCNFIKGQFNTLKREKVFIQISSICAIHKTLDNREKNTHLHIQSPRKDSFCLFCYHLPLDKISVNSPYGYREDPINHKLKFHYGIDLCAKDHEPIYSLLPGIIEKIGYSKKGYGNYIITRHHDFEVLYAHLSKVNGKKGDVVNAGEYLGQTGSTGRSTGEHLHLSIKFKGKNINPMLIINYISAFIKDYKK